MSLSKCKESIAREEKKERKKKKKKKKKKKQMYVLLQCWIKFQEGYGSRECRRGYRKKTD